MAPAAEDGPLRIGARFLDKYEICEPIGHGGQAWVYRGHHAFTAREVAIKVVHSPHAMTHELLVRGKEEARALGRLDHPNIVVMHDAGITDEGLFYIVMELLRGRSLRAALRAHGRLGVEEVLRLAIQAGEALQVAHSVDLIHRDLKPDNIFLTRDNRLKVLDFGIAKMLNEIGFTTREDVVVGSLLYMSPEQIQGLPLTVRSDICALGLVVFEALLGRHPSLLVFERDLSEGQEPYRRPTVADVAALQLNRMPPLLSDLDPSIPVPLARVVERAMAKVARDRFSTMSDFISELRGCLETYRGAPGEQPSVSDRDLSLPQASEEPAASQRGTQKWEQPRESTGAESVPTVAGATRVAFESDEVTKLITPVPIASDLNLPASRLLALDPDHTSAGARIGRTGVPAAVKHAIIGGCLFGAAIGTVGALAYFGVASRTASEARVGPDSVAGARMAQNSVAVSLSPATPAGVESASDLPAQPGGSVATPTPLMTPSPAKATTPAKSVDQLARGTPPVERGLSSNRNKESMPSVGDARTKLSHRPKLIYGD